MRNRSTLIVLAVAASLLGACHKHREPPPEDQQIENQQAETPPPPVEQTQQPVVESQPKVVERPVVPKVKPAPKPTADEQMLDDADATGMTSHSTPDSGATGGAGNSQP
jgi:outer membrane biosynthesis protein TonB